MVRLMKEILDFEKACGVKAVVFLKNRSPENVDLRDIFIWISENLIIVAND